MGLPDNLLRQRPDIRRAERELVSQTARIGVAKADLYPSFFLTGLLGLEATTDFFDSCSKFYTLDPTFRWNLFSGGRVRNQIKVEDARTGVNNVPGVNIVDVGKAIDKRLGELIPELPVGIEVSRFHWQSNIVADAVNGFLISFAEAVLIVLVVLAIFMGLRMGVIIGVALVLTILASFLVMAILEIDLQHMSLGALIIALGMMIKNAIVLLDQVNINLSEGHAPYDAVVEAAVSRLRPGHWLLQQQSLELSRFFRMFSGSDWL